jgi:hypothetical protein
MAVENRAIVESCSRVTNLIIVVVGVYKKDQRHEYDKEVT